MKKFRFVDLFSGIGAFHLALSSMGGECVFAADIDKYAVETYKENFHMNSMCDISTVKEQDIPKHDVLCAGFPCQPFSQGGHMNGFNDTRGTLFFEIERILKYHKTKYIILENVKHLVNHDNGNTFKVIKERLINLGYILTETPLILSPHQFGIPQKRERIFILGIHNSILKNKKYLNISPVEEKEGLSVYDILEDKVDEKYNISEYENKVLSAWDEFRKIVGCTSTPILFDEFGQTYDVEDLVDWKQNYILSSRQLYEVYKKDIDIWSEKWEVKNFKLRDRRLEWQAGSETESVFDSIISPRQSGIRCKRPNYFPTLVAIVQTPIIGKFKRRLTPREAARLQSFPDTYILNRNDQKAFKQLGNSANVDIIKFVAEQLFSNTGNEVL